MNEIIDKFTGSERIRFIRETYPCDLTIETNNVALVFNVHGIIEGENIILEALYKNFERIIVNIPDKKVNPIVKQMSAKELVYSDTMGIINPFEEQYELYKQRMPDYSFYRLGKNTIFGTRIASDRENLESSYIFSGDEILTRVIDTHWIHRCK